MEIVIGLSIGCLLIAGVFLLAGRSTRPKAEMVYLPSPSSSIPIQIPERKEAMKPPLDANSAMVMQGAGQQIGSLGKNEAFDIEHTWTESGQKLRFSRVDLPPLIRPMQLAPPSEDKELKKLRKAAERVAEALSSGTVKPTFAGGFSGSLNVDGVPCMLKKSENGYDLMLIKPDGKLEFMCHLGASL